jgi:hypothetical protein
MGYLVKASFNAEPRSYALDGIRTDVKAGLLPLTAMVREEKQDFWYSVGELIGERHTELFKFMCPHCKNLIEARKIDIGLQQKCDRCNKPSAVPDKEELKRVMLQDGAPTKKTNGLILYGGLAALIGVTGVLFTLMTKNESSILSLGLFFGLMVSGVMALRVGVQVQKQAIIPIKRSKK